MSGPLLPKIQEFVHKLLCGEILDWSEYNKNRLNFTAIADALKQYGYAVQQTTSSSKECVFAFRDFRLPRNKPLPFEPQFELYILHRLRRRKAQEYEETRQKMGYVTEQELALATECIRAGNLVADTNTQGWLIRYLKTRYGLLWLGYEEKWTCQQFGGTTPIRKSQKTGEERLQNLRRIRIEIITQEEYAKLRSLLLKTAPKPCSYVQDFIAKQATEGQHRQLNSRSTPEQPSLIEKLTDYFDSAPKQREPAEIQKKLL